AVAAAPTDATAAGSTDPVYANPIELTSADAQDKNLFAWVSVLELLALVLLPGLYVVAVRRRPQGGAR
ncbi:MAG: phosphate transporter substrate-binding protein, partial [Nocardioidaceae bacterium]|nr:phosphate transporter substrate-binding protein [Nocardioidaceae bacterium]